MSKDHFIRFRVAGWEKVHISKNAEKAHMTISEFVRAAAMDQDVTVVEGLQGNNLNQLTVMARQGRVGLVDMEPFMEVYERTWQTLNSLLSRVA